MNIIGTTGCFQDNSTVEGSRGSTQVKHLHCNTELSSVKYNLIISMQITVPNLNIIVFFNFPFTLCKLISLN